MAPTKRNNSLRSTAHSSDVALRRSFRAAASASKKAVNGNDPIYNKTKKIADRARTQIDRYVEARDKLSAASSAASKTRKFAKNIGGFIGRGLLDPGVLSEEVAARAARDVSTKRFKDEAKKERNQRGPVKRPITRS